MRDRNRREFLADVGRGMFVASLGSAIAADLELAPAWAGEAAETLKFGKLEPLVDLMQQTPIAKLLPAVVEKMKAGTDLRTLIAAGALANARTFGGHDYTGYHALMALAPAYEMAGELPEAQRPLPVLKVLYRNTNRMQEEGGCKHEALHPVKEAADLPKDKPGGELLREATRRRDQQGADETFAALAARGPIGEAFNHLQFAVEDEVDVHRVVLAWRSWVLRDFTGEQYAHTLLRQSVLYCVDAEKQIFAQKRSPGIRATLPKLLDQYRLAGRKPGDRKADDKWIDSLSRTIYGDGRERAAEAVAAALAEGMSPDAVGEAISLAANRLVLCDPGRKRAEPGKPVGSVHGASVGVHASDSANAWRNIARVSNTRNTFASLICGAYHTGGQNGGQNKEAYPSAEQLDKVKAKDAGNLLKLTEAAIKEKDQAGAAALVHVYLEQNHAARPIFDLLLRYAVSEDGALHAEKYYRTVTEEFAATRPAFRGRHLVALARVTASEYGQPAAGYAEARRLLKL